MFEPREKTTPANQTEQIRKCACLSVYCFSGKNTSAETLKKSHDTTFVSNSTQQSCFSLPSIFDTRKTKTAS